MACYFVSYSPLGYHFVLQDKSNLAPVVTTELVPDTETVPSTVVPSPGAETGSEVFPFEVTTGAAGVESTTAQPQAIMDVPEVMPDYEGGIKAMMKFIQRNMRYPNRARQVGIEGRVFVKFVVNYEGKVVNVEIVKGISEECDKEAARVIAMMPNWRPGMQNKMPVSVRMILPINFKLEN
jgi:protein TonB